MQAKIEGEKQVRPAYIAIFIVLAVGAYYILSRGEPADGRLDSFASCLNKSGAVMYGAYWCDHCAEQKRMFGSSFRLIRYVECDARGQNADPAACGRAGVEAYPWWVVNGTPYRGVQQLDELSRATGCQLTKS